MFFDRLGILINLFVINFVTTTNIDTTPKFTFSCREAPNKAKRKMCESLFKVRNNAEVFKN